MATDRTSVADGRAVKFDVEPNGAERLDFMLDVRKDDAHRAGLEPLLLIERLAQPIEKRPVEDMDSRPDSRLRRVARDERARHGGFGKFRRATVRCVARRHLPLVAPRALELDAEPRAAAGFRQNPRPLAHRRIVAHVLVVAALESRDPVRLLVSTEGDDLSGHDSPSLASFR